MTQRSEHNFIEEASVGHAQFVTKETAKATQAPLGNFGYPVNNKNKWISFGHE